MPTIASANVVPIEVPTAAIIAVRSPIPTMRTSRILATSTITTDVIAIIAARPGEPAPLKIVAPITNSANATMPMESTASASAPPRYASGYASRITPEAAPLTGAAIAKSTSSEKRIAPRT